MIVALFYLLEFDARKTVKGILLFVLLYYASVSDLTTRSVPDIIHALILVVGLIDIQTDNIATMAYGLLVVPIPLLAAAVLKEGSIGGADIKLTATCSFLLGFERGLFAMFIGLSMSIIGIVISRKLHNCDMKKSYALIPYLAIGNALGYLL
ncbi:MAG: prepilin peptidase [Saccharofermentanales bacterium]